jgi:hypothetical protein
MVDELRVTMWALLALQMDEDVAAMKAATQKKRRDRPAPSQPRSSMATRGTQQAAAATAPAVAGN